MRSHKALVIFPRYSLDSGSKPVPRPSLTSRKISGFHPHLPLNARSYLLDLLYVVHTRQRSAIRTLILNNDGCNSLPYTRRDLSVWKSSGRRCGDSAGESVHKSIKFCLDPNWHFASWYTYKLFPQFVRGAKRITVPDFKSARSRTVIYVD